MGNKGDGNTTNCIVVFLKRCLCTLHHGPRKAAVAPATIHPNVEKVFRRKKKPSSAVPQWKGQLPMPPLWGSAMSVHAVPGTMALERRGVVRSVGQVPHWGRATHPHAHLQPHPHRKSVCSKISCLGCSNLGLTGLLNLHYLVHLHLLSRRCGFHRGLLSHLRIALCHPSPPRVRKLPSFLLPLLL